MNSVRCNVSFKNNFRRCSKYLDTLRAKAKIKLPEEDGIGRGDNVTWE